MIINFVATASVKGKWGQDCSGRTLKVFIPIPGSDCPAGWVNRFNYQQTTANQGEFKAQLQPPPPGFSLQPQQEAFRLRLQYPDTLGASPTPIISRATPGSMMGGTAPVVNNRGQAARFVHVAIKGPVVIKANANAPGDYSGLDLTLWYWIPWLNLASTAALGSDWRRESGAWLFTPPKCNWPPF